jgi:heptaprenyl diphosphate synthase
LSTLEYLIPRPLPFMRIGLANLPLILALDLFSPGSFALLVLIKITGQALITGTLFSYVFVFSLAGSSVSALIMYGLRRILGKNRISFIGLGVCGAVFSNLVQLVLARSFVFGQGVRFLAPLFLASGLITGGGLGFFCEAFAARSRWFRRALGDEAAFPAGAAVLAPDAAAVPAGMNPGGRRTREPRRRRQEQWNRLFRSDDLFITGLFIMLMFLFTSSLMFKALQCLLFWLLARLSGKKGRPLTAVLLTAGIIFFNLLVPYGKVLIQAGPLTVTQGALLAGLRRAVTLEGLILLSGAFIRADLRLPGAFGDILGESFRIFAVLEERKTAFSRGQSIEGIDGLMLELDRDNAKKNGGGRGPLSVPARRHPASLPLLAALTLLTALSALADEKAVLAWIRAPVFTFVERN